MHTNSHSSEPATTSERRMRMKKGGGGNPNRHFQMTWCLEYQPGMYIHVCASRTIDSVMYNCPFNRPSTPLFELLENRFQEKWLNERKEAERKQRHEEYKRVCSSYNKHQFITAVITTLLLLIIPNYLSPPSSPPSFISPFLSPLPPLLPFPNPRG